MVLPTFGVMVHKTARKILYHQNLSPLFITDCASHPSDSPSDSRLAYGKFEEPLATIQKISFSHVFGRFNINL